MSKYNGNREFKINIPGSVKLIIDVLENNGYEAFAVGGCVRDTILDRETSRPVLMAAHNEHIDEPDETKNIKSDLEYLKNMKNN